MKYKCILCKVTFQGKKIISTSVILNKAVIWKVINHEFGKSISVQYNPINLSDVKETISNPNDVEAKFNDFFTLFSHLNRCL